VKAFEPCIDCGDNTDGYCEACGESVCDACVDDHVDEDCGNQEN
jgi:hypothetical protein